MPDSLVQELQRAAMDDAFPLRGALRKGLVVATKLGASDFLEWCNLEMNGYSRVAGKDIPDYRWIDGLLEARNHNGMWVPVVGPAPELMDVVKRRPIVQSVSTLEDLLQKAEVNDERPYHLHMPLPDKTLELVFASAVQRGIIPHVAVQQSQVAGVLESVRSRLLAWSLELEALGITGEGMSFSKDEVQKSQGHVFNISAEHGDVNLNLDNVISGDLVSGRASVRRGDGLEEVLTKLTSLVEDLRSKLPPGKAEQVSMDFEAFVKEITSRSPRENRYTVTGDGLVEAAEAVLTFPAKVLKEYVGLAIVAAKATATGAI